MKRLLVGIGGVALGYALGTVGATAASYAAQDWRWGLVGMVPGLVVATLGLLYMFEVRPFG